MVSERTKAQALHALDGTASIVKNEMIVRGYYIDPRFFDAEMAAKGSICGGHKFCVVGSLFVAAGIKPRITGEPPWESIEFEEPEPQNRDHAMRHRPGLRLAYDALNKAAAKFAATHNIVISSVLSATAEGPLETLFENGRYPNQSKITRSDLLRVINSAKRLVRAA